MRRMEGGSVSSGRSACVPGGGRWVDRHDDGNGRQTFCRRETKGPRSRVLTEAMKVDIVFVYLCLVCVVSPASPRRVCVCVSWSARDWGGVARKIPSDESGETTAGSTRLVTADSRLDGVEERSRGRVPLLSLRERASGATTRCCVRQRRVKCHPRGIFFICQAGRLHTRGGFSWFIFSGKNEPKTTSQSTQGRIANRGFEHLMTELVGKEVFAYAVFTY